MKPFSPFDHRRDNSLGNVVRQALTPDDHDDFVTRVMERAHAGALGFDVERWWVVLGRWARPGLAAAALIAGLALFALAPTEDGGATFALEDTISPVPDQEELATFLVDTEPPDFDVILASGVVRPMGR